MARRKTQSRSRKRRNPRLVETGWTPIGTFGEVPTGGGIVYRVNGSHSMIYTREGESRDDIWVWKVEDATDKLAIQDYDLSEVADFTGYPLEEIQTAAQSDNPVTLAMVWEAIAMTYGALDTFGDPDWEGSYDEVWSEYVDDYNEANLAAGLSRSRNPCKKGDLYVKRKGYKTKKGTRVPPTSFCIPDRGRKGRGPDIVPELREGKLGGPGYAKKSTAQRHKLLGSCVKKYGYESCRDSLQYLLVVGKRTMSNAVKAKIAADKKWLMGKYGGEGSVGPRKKNRRNPNGRDVNFTPEATYWFRSSEVKWYSISPAEAARIYEQPSGSYATIEKRKRKYEVAVMAVMPPDYTSKSDVERGLGMALWTWDFGPKSCATLKRDFDKFLEDDLRRAEIHGREIPNYARRYLALFEQLCGAAQNPIGYTVDGQITYPDKRVKFRREYVYVPTRGFGGSWVAVDQRGKAVGFVALEDIAVDFDAVEVIDKLNDKQVQYLRAGDDPIETYRKGIVKYGERYDQYVVQGVTNEGDVVIDNQGGEGGEIRIMSSRRRNPRAHRVANALLRGEI